MTTLPFAAYIPLGFMSADLAVEGEVTDDEGTADPFFRITVVISGDDRHPVSRNPVTIEERLASWVATLAGHDPDILAEAMRIEGWSGAGRGPNDPDAGWKREPDVDAVREFGIAIAEAAE